MDNKKIYFYTDTNTDELNILHRIHYASLKKTIDLLPYQNETFEEFKESIELNNRFANRYLTLLLSLLIIVLVLNFYTDFLTFFLGDSIILKAVSVYFGIGFILFLSKISLISAFLIKNKPSYFERIGFILEAYYYVNPQFDKKGQELNVIYSPTKTSIITLFFEIPYIYISFKSQILQKILLSKVYKSISPRVKKLNEHVMPDTVFRKAYNLASNSEKSPINDDGNVRDWFLNELLEIFQLKNIKANVFSNNKEKEIKESTLRIKLNEDKSRWLPDKYRR